MKLKGVKRRQLFDELILPHLPKDLQNYRYVEPFGGTFAVASFLPIRPKSLIYSDITVYKFKLETTPDETYYSDYSHILRMFDKPDVIMYLDPPYVGKEDWYDVVNENIHIELHKVVSSLKHAKIFISYEAHPLILELYKGFKIFNYPGTRENFRKEILIKKGE